MFGSGVEREAKEFSPVRNGDLTMMPQYSSVTVVHSCNVQADQDVLIAMFGFQVEKQSEATLLLQENLALILLSTDEVQPPGTFSLLVFKEEVLRKARAENSELMLQAEWQSYFLGPKTVIMVKFKLSGGHTIVATTPDGWTDSSARAKTLQFSLTSTYSNGNGCHQYQSKTPQPVRRPLSDSTKMIRSLSLPMIHADSPTSNPNQRLFPSLDVKYLSTGDQLVPFQVNSQLEIPVETDLLVGTMVFLLQPTNPEDDPYWNERIFSKKKRRLVMQLQGKLKYEPQGPLYAGMEISDPMKLGLMASGICNIILKYIQNFDSNLHYSFGDDVQKAHMTALAENFFHQLIVTPPGKEPPILGGELSEIVKSRKSLKSRIQWNTEDTYTMSYHTMYIDLPSWTTSNIPLVRDLKLQTFWANSLLKIVLYEPDKPNTPHVAADNKYIMSIQVNYLQPSERKRLEDSLSIDTPSSEDDPDLSDGASSWAEMGLVEEMGMSPDGFGSTSGESDKFFDTIQIQSDSSASLPNMPPEINTECSHSFVLSTVDEYCPFIVDMASAKGSYESIFVFRGRYPHSRPIFRDLQTARDALARCRPSVNEDWFSPRLSPEERTRRILGLKYIKGLTEKEFDIQQRIFEFQNKKTTYDRKFLREYLSKFKKKSKNFFAVARAVGDHHWVEEWAIVAGPYIDFYRIDKKKPGFQIGLSSIIKVEEMETAILQGFYFLSIETFGRTTYLMFPSQKERARWSGVIQEKSKANNGLDKNNSLTNHLINVDDPMSEFLHKSTTFDCNKRKILNCRRLSFQAPKPTSSQDTLALAEQALIKATALQAKGPNDADLMDFLDCAAALKDANAYDLNDNERLAFFLNVYHVVIMHAFIVLGPPKSGLEWLTYFNNFAYQCSDDVFSLTELEHNIIRADMNYPSQFLSRFVLPKSQFRFAITKPDFRINCALNSGSLSMPTAAVPLYKPDFVDDQLDQVVKMFVELTVFLNEGKRDVSVTLPRICKWYATDFGDGSTSDILKVLTPFLSEEKQRTSQKLWNERKDSYDVKSVKFLPFIFECRFLVLEAFQNYTIE